MGHIGLLATVITYQLGGISIEYQGQEVSRQAEWARHIGQERRLGEGTGISARHQCFHRCALRASVLMVMNSSQPQSREKFETKRKEEMEKPLETNLTPGRYSGWSGPVRSSPCCPSCGSYDVCRMSGLDVDADAVDTFTEIGSIVWPVCLSDHMCRRCGHNRIRNGPSLSRHSG